MNLYSSESAAEREIQWLDCTMNFIHWRKTRLVKVFFFSISFSLYTTADCEVFLFNIIPSELWSNFHVFQKYAIPCIGRNWFAPSSDTHGRELSVRLSLVAFFVQLWIHLFLHYSMLLLSIARDWVTFIIYACGERVWISRRKLFSRMRRRSSQRVNKRKRRSVLLCSTRKKNIRKYFREWVMKRSATLTTTTNKLWSRARGKSFSFMLCFIVRHCFESRKWNNIYKCI